MRDLSERWKCCKNCVSQEERRAMVDDHQQSNMKLRFSQVMYFMQNQETRLDVFRHVCHRFIGSCFCGTEWNLRTFYASLTCSEFARHILCRNRHCCSFTRAGFTAFEVSNTAEFLLFIGTHVDKAHQPELYWWPGFELKRSVAIAVAKFLHSGTHDQLQIGSDARHTFHTVNFPAELRNFSLGSVYVSSDYWVPSSSHAAYLQAQLHDVFWKHLSFTWHFHFCYR
jgi:hypothetical protein